MGLAAPTARQQLRGDPARLYLLGSLHYSARQPVDIPLLAPRALGWYRRLLDLGATVPFNVVLDLGYLLLEGEDFRFRSFFADATLAADERAGREAYETRVLVRRLQEANFPRLRRLVVDNQAPDLAVTRVLEILLRPLGQGLTRRFGIEEAHSLRADFERADFRTAREAFEAAVDAPGLLLEQLVQLADEATALDLDRLLHEEDFYEIEHIRVFPRESLREVARRIKTVERLLGPSRRSVGAALRERALADTTLESLGTYPTGGIAELTTTGPIENLVSSELIYLEPEQPIDPFLVRYAENELLRYLRDSAVLRMMRRSVVFIVEDCTDFTCPVTSGRELYGTKVIRCLMGLVLALATDLLQIFRRDDINLSFKLLAPAGGPTETVGERQEILDVLHLLFREKEEQGTASVELALQSLAEALAALPRDPQRFRSVVVLARPETVAGLDGLRLGTDTRLIPVAVGQREAEPLSGLTLSLAGEPFGALRQAREEILEMLTG
ncbi:MAG: hypothetical protein HUU35_04110 [Armatimonadetes bacterium]|nr:hypothetical protein [Armatimonadota bacterium]